MEFLLLTYIIMSATSKWPRWWVNSNFILEYIYFTMDNKQAQHFILISLFGADGVLV